MPNGETSRTSRSFAFLENLERSRFAVLAVEGRRLSRRRCYYVFASCARRLVIVRLCANHAMSDRTEEATEWNEYGCAEPGA